MINQAQDILPIDAINEFYRLKDTYETNYYKKYVEPIIKSKNSKGEKRTNFSKLPKNECINCKKNVGTIFSVNTKDNVKKYTVKCGDLNNPCPLDIEILYSFREPMDLAIRDGMTILEKIKMEIIKEKNNAIYFNKNVAANFEKITEELKTESENLGFIMETNVLRNNNPEKRALLKKMGNEFGTSCIIPFKQSIDKYKETNNTSYLTDAVHFYVNEMIPKLHEIQHLKYDVNMVELDSVYKLIQLPNSFENNEIFNRNDDKIVKIVYGVESEKNDNKSPKTKKNMNLKSKAKAKSKTIKLKPIVLNEAEDESYNFSGEQEVGQEEVGQEEVGQEEVGQELEEVGQELEEVGQELEEEDKELEKIRQLWKLQDKKTNKRP